MIEVEVYVGILFKLGENSMGEAFKGRGQLCYLSTSTYTCAYSGLRCKLTT